MLCLIAQSDPVGAILRSLQFPLNRVAPNSSIRICGRPREAIYQYCIGKGEDERFLICVAEAAAKSWPHDIL